MSCYSINDKHELPNSFILPPSESNQDEGEFDITKIFQINSPQEPEINEINIFEKPLEIRLEKEIFDIIKFNKAKKESRSCGIEKVKIIESNGVKPASNQILNSSTEETKEFSNIIDVDKQENKYIKKKRKRRESGKDSNKKKSRKRPDNCRRMIGKHFFNSFLIKSKMNSSIQKKGPYLYFVKFPPEFIRETVERKNKNYLGKTLEYLLTKKELYIKCLKNHKQIKKLSSSHEKEAKKALERYEHNFNVLKKLNSNFDNNNILEKYGLKKYLGMTYEKLYKEYSESYRYKKKEKLAESKTDFDEFQKLSEYNAFTGFFKK